MGVRENRPLPPPMSSHHGLTYSPLRLMALALSATLVPLGSTMIAVALPQIGVEFGKEPGQLTQWLVSSYLLIGIVGQGPAGKLGDYWGYEKTLRLGQGIFGLGCILTIMFPGFGTLAMARALMAAGGCFMLPTIMAVFRVSVPAEKRHRIFGYFGALMGMAAAIGPFLGGYLVHHFGWRSIFFVNLPPLFVSVVLSWTYFKEVLHQRPEHRFSIDFIGILFMTLFLVFLILGLKNLFWLLAPALFFFVIFLLWEKNTPHPLIDLKLFSHRTFATGCAMIGLQNLGMYALLFQMPFLLKLLYFWEPEKAGHAITFFMVSMMVASFFGGRIAEKIGVMATCLAGSLISVGGLTSLTILSPEGDHLLLIGGLILGGIGLGLSNGPTQSAALGAVESHQSGIASGILATCRYLGGVLGISLLGFLFSRSPSGATLTDHRKALWVFAGSFALAAFASIFLPAAKK